MLVASNGRVIARCELHSPMLQHDDPEANYVNWSLAMPVWEWVQLIWTLTHAPRSFLSVEVVNEGLLTNA